MAQPRTPHAPGPAGLPAASPLRARWDERLAFLLLATTTGVLVVSPLLPDTIGGRAVLQALITSVILIAAQLERHQRAFAGTVVLIAAWFGASWAAVLHPLPPRWLALTAHVLSVLVLLVGFWGTLRRVFAAREVDASSVAAGICGYLLMALVWTSLYQLVATVDPTAFQGGLTGSTLTEAAYFSLVTITTVGYGDIVAHSPVARIWSGLEAVAGNLYIAVLIARLVSRWQSRPHR
ncbi:MAG: hypothetical protein BGO51_24095 [Rhodospirillales bacterium 69-11]|nr:two pore domain potassium channel family protein [Rhodospirillales bacterium]OJW22324.1 MAG: hypothetical protein BGO51_24095 [Rhodospirillales bacterium 69-11]